MVQERSSEVDPPPTQHDGNLFVVGLAAESLLAGVAIALAIALRWLGFDQIELPFTYVRATPLGFMVGLAGVVPLVGMMVWATHSRLRPMREFSQWVDAWLRPLVAPWKVWQVALVSLAAGVGEEFLFRGLMQAAIDIHFGTACAIAVTGVIFGLAHAATTVYAVLATAISVYLGLLFVATGDLTAPIVAHAVYDFVAILYIQKRAIRPRPTSASND